MPADLNSYDAVLKQVPDKPGISNMLAPSGGPITSAVPKGSNQVKRAQGQLALQGLIGAK